MNLTTQQLAALKADIAADPVLNAFPNNGDGAASIADAYNLVANPAFIVWQTAVKTGDIMSNGFVWTEVDNLTAAKYRTWELMCQLGTINPSKSNIRQGLRDCWGGNTSVQYLAMLPHLKRSATRGEKLFASGAGTDANPATMGAEGALSYQNVLDARSS